MTHYGSGTASEDRQTFPCVEQCYKKTLVLLQKKWKLQVCIRQIDGYSPFNKQHNLHAMNTAGEYADVSEKST